MIAPARVHARVVRWILIGCLGLTTPWRATAAASTRDADHVLVVVNAASEASRRLGDVYARAREIPSGQVLRVEGLPADPPDEIDRPTFDRAIARPIVAWLASNRAQDRILFIVLTKGIPLRIRGTPGRSGSAASLDSELTLLYRRLTGVAAPFDGPVPNPYFLGDRTVDQAKPFSRTELDTYLVTRLDGFTVDDAIQLVDRAGRASREGRFLLDGRPGPDDLRNRWLHAAQDRLVAAGVPRDRVLLDESPLVLTGQSDVIGYFSWGSNDPAIRRRTFDLTFKPGAIAGMFVSHDARTFRPPPATWRIGNYGDHASWFAGSPQSLAGDLIHDGVTGLGGQAGEPLLASSVRPDILFPAYVAGFSLAESFYLATPSLSWQTVIVGDPLCAPFRERGPERADPAIDPDTDLPSEFSRRRLAALSNAQGSTPESRRLFVKAEILSQRDDAAGARGQLERALEAAPSFLAALYALAAQDEGGNDYDAAARRYRKILEIDASQVPALNNLAYALAERHNLEEAMPLAERARELAPRSPEVADTLGWLLHAKGEHGRALALLSEAARLAPQVAEIRLHLALACDAVGQLAAAKRELAVAVAIDPRIAMRPEAASLLKR